MSERGPSPVDPSLSERHADALEDYAKHALNERSTFFNRTDKLEMAEKRYTETVADETADKLKHMVETGHVSKERLLEKIVETIALERTYRTNAESDELGKKMSTEGKNFAVRALNTFKNNRKVRLAVGLGVLAASGGLAAAGFLPGAVALKGVHAAIRAGAGYLSAREATDRGLEWKARREKFGTGELAGLTGTEDEMKTQALNLDAEQRKALLLKLTSSTTERRRSDENQSIDSQRIKVLHEIEVDRIRAQVIAEHGGKSRRELLAASPDIVQNLLKADLESARGQIASDKKSLRIRRAFAAAVGIGLGATALNHAISEASNRNLPWAGEQSGVGTVHESGINLEPKGFPEYEVHSMDFSNYPDVITDQIDGNEDSLDAARKHLSRLQGWSQMPEGTRSLIEKDFASKITRVGDHWRYTKADISGYFK